MNFVNGKIVNESECDSVLERIEEMLISTLKKPPLDVNQVINACDTMVKNVESLEVMKKLPELGISKALTDIYMKQIKQMLSAEAIRARMRIELGENYDKAVTLRYVHSHATAVQTLTPLGVLFHITAGNVDGLPFVSILEGLLTGNINIVKLPKEEGGITVLLLAELLKLAPSLAEYVYVFDYSSKDVAAMQKLAKVADAIVIWGGDEAISAVRRMALPNTRIIEWGHKISFAYVTKEGATVKSLEKLAYHICLTNQLFCSSCQGVFFDSDDIEDIYEFCEKFLPILEKASQENPHALGEMAGLFIQAELTIHDYQRRIENQASATRIFREQNVSITAYADSQLEPSPMYRNIWVKPLKNDDIIKLRPYKGYLQTAALICGKNEHEELAQKLLRAGVVKVSDGREMSNYACGEAHDGVFTLRCYTKWVSVQDYDQSNTE
ncbi:MAG: acyl-CoA reductase [Lachnospiraceae bacterium]|jgi:hypothetical protein|nr:acyl-CoA reductase [Lachnospiraceae bacterium]